MKKKNATTVSIIRQGIEAYDTKEPNRKIGGGYVYIFPSGRMQIEMHSFSDGKELPEGSYIIQEVGDRELVVKANSKQ